MIRSVTITNPQGESLVLELAHPELSGLAVESITGLGPSKVNIGSSELATMDGSIFASARAQERNVVFTLIMLPIPDIETARQKTYKYFPIIEEWDYSDGWVIKGDIRKCFPSTDHEKLKAAVFPRLGDDRFRKLLGQYIDQVDGLALGHQTSHICAVYYMSKVLHYINQDLGCSLSGMYMDDWYGIVETKEEAKAILEAAREKFALLGYELNEKTEIYPLRHGIDFCGFRVYITRTGKVIRKLRTSSKKRIKRRIKKWDRDYAEGLITKDEIETSFQSSCAHIKHGDTKDLISDLRSRVDDIYEKHQNKEEDPSEQENQYAFVRSSCKAQRKRCRKKVHLPGV